MYDYKEKQDMKYSYVNYEIDNPSFLKMGRFEPFAYTGLCAFEFLMFRKIVDLITTVFDNNDLETQQRRRTLKSNLRNEVEKLDQYEFLQEIELLKWIDSYHYVWETKNHKDECKRFVADEIHKLRNEERFLRGIIKLLQFTTIFLYFTFDRVGKDGEILQNSQRHFHFFCFDGIETYIALDNKTIFIGNDDVKSITLAIYAFEQQMSSPNSFFSSLNSDYSFSNWFKIIVTLRDTTERYLPTELLSENNTLQREISVNVTNWYRIDDITIKRLPAKAGRFDRRLKAALRLKSPKRTVAKAT